MLVNTCFKPVRRHEEGASSLLLWRSPALLRVKPHDEMDLP
jgi:hypothetical protein